MTSASTKYWRKWQMRIPIESRAGFAMNRAIGDFSRDKLWWRYASSLVEGWKNLSVASSGIECGKFSRVVAANRWV